MFVIDIKSLDFCFEEAEENLFNNLDLAVNAGEVVGLVGGNGTGKSTLIKIIVGEIKLPVQNNGVARTGDVGYLAQEADFNDLNKNLDQLFAEKFINQEWRGDLAKSLAGLENLNNSTKLESLSGGQKTRLALDLILAEEERPEVLVLDEPTNNLDQEGLIWLEEVIRDFSSSGGGVLIASHERVFLDEVVDRIVAIEDKALASYGGNYSSYKEQLEVKLKVQKELAERSKSEEKKLTKQLQKQKDNLNKYLQAEKKSKNKRAQNSFKETQIFYEFSRDIVESRIGKKAKAINSKLNQLEEVEAPDKIAVLDVRFGAQIPSSKLVFKLSGVGKSFGKKEVLKDFDLEVRGPERVLVAGKNGSGKSTLLSLMAGKLSADSGEIVFGENLSLGYFSQDVYGLDLDQTALESLEFLEKDRARIYTLLIKAGISKSSADKKLKELSRGQQAKVGFVKLMLAQPEVLILDYKMFV
jgi:macrolide transport system ATP-binding/permease protein